MKQMYKDTPIFSNKQQLLHRTLYMPLGGLNNEPPILLSTMVKADTFLMSYTCSMSSVGAFLAGNNWLG